MSPSDPLVVLDPAQRNELEALLMDFDQAWNRALLREFDERITSHDSRSFRDAAIVELVKIDLQRVWADGGKVLLDDYLQRYPSLGDVDTVSPELIFSEYDARTGFDKSVGIGEYESRFPAQYKDLLKRVEKTLESGPVDSLRRTQRERVQASIDTSRSDDLRDTKAGNSRSSGDAELPAEFGRYRILKVLGAGAMGRVYLAHDSQLDRHVALKTPSFSGSRDDELVTRFYREARAAAKLQHRNICPIYDVGEIDGRHFISMGFVNGRCMSDFIKPDKLPPQRTSAILVQRLAVALSEAHEHGVIHRDLKPANVMIDLKKEPIVMDFGLARQMDVESRVTQSGMAVGTPAYMSPEQIRGDLDEVGPASDVYALGVILYELLTGQLPFRGPIAKVAYSIVHETPKPPTEIRAGVDSELEFICCKMMAKRKEDRFKTMAGVARALKAYVKGERARSNANDTANESTAKSSDTKLSETGALNAFFAAQAEPTANRTIVEPTRKSAANTKTPVIKASRNSGNDNRNRKWWTLAGFAGGMSLLLGVIIYFNGGKIVLDSDSDAIVTTDQKGNVTIQPGTQVEPKPTPSKPRPNLDFESGFVPLFTDGISGWNGLTKYWKWENGELVGTSSNGRDLRNNTALCSDRNYQDFELRFDVKITGSQKPPNSGVQFRSKILDQSTYKVQGPQADIGGTYWGGLWDEASTGMMYRSNESFISSSVKKSDWNRYRLRVEGNRVSIHINDMCSVDQTFPALPKDGILGFQLHRGCIMSVRFRNVRIKELHSEVQPQTKKTVFPESNDLPTFNPKIELLNEWENGALDPSSWYLAGLSPDGHRVAFRLSQGPLTIADVDSKQTLSIPLEMQSAISLAFSSNGKLIATGHDDKNIRLWNADSFEPIGEPFESPIEQNVRWVHLSADGTKLIAMGNDHSKVKNLSTFCTWDVSSRKLISRFQAGMDDQRFVDSIDASADGTRVAVMSLRDGATLWDTTTGKQIPVKFEMDEQIAGMKRVTGMDLSADGSKLAYGVVWGAASFAAIMDTSTGKEVWSSGKQNGRVHCVQFTNDGKWLASTAGRTKAHQLSLWDVASGQETERWMYPYDSDDKDADRVKFLSFSDDGSRLLLTSGYMPVVVWNLFERIANDSKANSVPKLSSEAAIKPEGKNSDVAPSRNDRAVAQKIVEFGGRVQLVGSGNWIHTLPDGEIRVSGVSFHRKQNQFNDGHIALLGQLPEVRSIYFYPNKMTNEGVATLAEMENVVENVRSLVFNRMDLDPKGLAALAKLKRLEHLTLHHTNLINDDLKLLSNFPALKALTLQQHMKKKFGAAFLTDECLKHLMMVRGLERLTLIGQPFTDACLVDVADMKIEDLWLATPNITDQAISQLREKRPRLGITRFKYDSNEND